MCVTRDTGTVENMTSDPRDNTPDTDADLEDFAQRVIRESAAALTDTDLAALTDATRHD